MAGTIGTRPKKSAGRKSRIGSQRGIQLTPKIAFAAGFDAGNASMRKGGRSKWSRSDFNAAARVTNALLRRV